MPTVCPIKKNAVERVRIETLAGKISELKSLLCPFSAQDLSRIETLELAVSVLTGTISSNRSTPKTKIPIDRKEYKKEHEQARRNKEAAAYNLLKQFILDKKLPGYGNKLEKSLILAVVIDHLRSISTPPVQVIAPILPTPPLTPPVPTISFSILSILGNGNNTPANSSDGSEDQDDKENETSA